MKKKNSDKQDSEHHRHSGFALDEAMLSEYLNQQAGDAKMPVVKYCGFTENIDRHEEQLWKFAEEELPADTQEKLWSHIQGCEYCLSQLIQIQKAIRETADKRILPFEQVRAEILKRKRTKIRNNLIQRLQDFEKNVSADILSQITGLKTNLQQLVTQTFVFPTPRFVAVFGEFHQKMISPFGKIRYPVTFEWRPFEDADEYVISIADIQWALTTTETRIITGPEVIQLEQGQEYMWELDVLRSGKILTQESGFFHLASMEDIYRLEEIERNLPPADDEMISAVFFAAILERSEYYMEAIHHYQRAFAIEALPGVAFRIASCYDHLELEDLRDEWNQMIPMEEE